MTEFVAAVAFVGGLVAGFAFRRPTPPFAQEVACDGQRVRLEAPTAEGLAVLIDLAEGNECRT